MGATARAEAHRRSRGGGGGAVRHRRRRARDRPAVADGVRVLDRELAPAARRGALLDELQRAAVARPPRRPERARRAGAVHRTARRAGAGPRAPAHRRDRGADGEEPAAHADVRVQLRRPGRDRRRDACDRRARSRPGAIDPAKIDERTISRHLYAPDMPDPDLVVRTSGEYRISNYLLWECAYSEFVFTDVLWPDFRTKDLVDAIAEYQSRKRRFGSRLATHRSDRRATRRSSERRVRSLTVADELHWCDVCRGCIEMKGSCCARSSSGRPTASSRSSRSATARSAPSPRACARRRASSAPGSNRRAAIALQCYRGRELDVVTQVETLESHRVAARGVRAAHARDPDARSRRPGRPGSRTDARAVPHAHRRVAHARRTPRRRWSRPRSSGSCSRSKASTRCSTAARAAATRRPARRRRRPSLIAFDLDEGGTLCRGCAPGRAAGRLAGRARPVAPHGRRRAERRARRAPTPETARGRATRHPGARAPRRAPSALNCASLTARQSRGREVGPSSLARCDPGPRPEITTQN